ALPAPVFAEWVSWAGNRERLREGLTPFLSRKHDPGFLDEFLDDAVKASRYSLEATLRMCGESFQEQIQRAVPTVVLAGKTDALLGPAVQRAIAADYSGKVVEIDCGHEMLIETPVEVARCVADFIAARTKGRSCP